MRSWLLIAVLITTQFSAFASESTAENGDRQKETIREGKVIKEKPREFHVEMKFSMEQRNKEGDLIVEGETIPGRTISGSIVQRQASTLDILDGQLIHLGGILGEGGTSFDIRITSLGNNKVRLAVWAKQWRTGPLQGGVSRSWSLRFKAAKTVKLGEEIKLEFGDEKILGTKCLFEGVIQAKAEEKK